MHLSLKLKEQGCSCKQLIFKSLIFTIMKKKLFFGVATFIFGVATVFNMNMLQSSNAGDVSLESIAVMAQAQYAGETVPGWTNNDKAHGYICNISGGMCDVSGQQ
jgi:hypothetical protein